MRQIKRFSGNGVPHLKSGEWATDEHFAFLGIGNGEYRVFQGVLDLETTQTIAGFEMSNGVLTIPANTPFSRIQELIDVIPKAAKRANQGNKSNVLQIVFENGTYVNDTGDWILFRDFGYGLLIRSTEFNTPNQLSKPVVFESEKALEFYNTNAWIKGVQFKHNEQAIYGYSSQLGIDGCSFDAQADAGVVCSDMSSIISLNDCNFKSFTQGESYLIESVSRGGSVHISKSYADALYHPKAIAKSISNGIVTATGLENLHITENSPNNSGIEILGEGTIGNGAFGI
jgi:hypothetical protein